MRELHLSEFKKDALRELGNMSASHAANSLSEMLGGKVEVTAPDLNVIRIRNLTDVMSGDEVVIPVYSRLYGGLSGSVILFFSNRYKPESVKRMSDGMMASLARAMARFFGVEVKPATVVLPAGKPASVVDYLRDKLGRGVEKAVFFRTNFLHSDSIICHFLLSLNYDDINYIMKAQVPEFTTEYADFSSMLETFERLKSIELRLYEIFKETKIPAEEVRSFLRNFNDSTLVNEALYTRLVGILTACNIGGDISISRKAPLELVFTVKDCNICRITPTATKGNVCYTTSTTLGRIFSELLKIGCEVREIECAKNNGKACIHHVSMEQLDVFQLLPQDRDLEILSSLNNEAIPLKRLSEESLGAINVYRQYGITEIEDGKAALTELGRIFLTFAQNKPSEEPSLAEEKPPWKS